MFGAVKLTKNVGPDNYSCSGYGIRFDPCLNFSLKLLIPGFKYNSIVAVALRSSTSE